MRIAIALAVAAFSLQAFAAKKYVFVGWDVSDATPAEILAHADKFDKTGCDGVAVALGCVLPSARQDVRKSLHVAELPRWRDENVSGLLPVLRAFGRHRSLRHSFFRIYTAPQKARLDWTDDGAWGLYADNLAFAAKLAKKVGFDGLVTDFEDYGKKYQSIWREGDPEWEAAKEIARRRGREVFSRVFAEYPEITILTFMLLTSDRAYAYSADPVAYMEGKRDLWPSFVNGIYDVIPPGAKIVDGNENVGYRARASRNDFYRSACDQLVGVLPLVAPENRAKYRAQTSTSFGLFIDSYLLPTNSPYYMEPVRGRRITHFEDNLRQATKCADEYVWLYGCRGFFVDWPADLKDKSGNVWRSSGGGTWRRKYFERREGRTKPWREMLDGDFDLVLRGVKDPARCVREEYAKQKAAGTFVDLFAGKAMGVATNGNANAFVRQPKFETDGWYGLRVKGRGEVVFGNVYFQYNGSWRWNLGAFAFHFAKADAEGWRDGVALVRIPDGANNIVVVLKAGKDEKVRKVEFRDLEIFRIK